MGRHATSTHTLVANRIQQKNPGWVFTPSDFVDLGSRSAVSLALLRLHKAGTIRQLARGLYDRPKHDPDLGALSPSTDAIAQALKARDAARLQPSGAYAANLLGLSAQVPMKSVFLTDGRSRTVQVGKQTIQLRHTSTRNLAAAGRTSGLLIQALRYLGRGPLSDDTFVGLTHRLTDDDKRQLRQDLVYAPQWMVPTLRRLADQAAPS